jgi:hypothetical protein
VNGWPHFNTGGGPQRETLPERQTITGNTDENAAIETAAGPRGPRPPLALPSVKPRPVFPAPRLLHYQAEVQAEGQRVLPKIDPGNRYTVAM